MLKKVLKLNLKLIGLIIIGLVLIQVITAYSFGYLLQKQLTLQFKQMTDSPFIKVVRHDYNRHAFSSDEVVELSIDSKSLDHVLGLLPGNSSESNGAGATQAYTIKYTTHVSQGVFDGLFHGYFMPTLGYAKTTIVYSDDLKKKLNKFFNNKDPLTIENVIYLNKAGRFIVSSPNFDYEEAVSGVKVLWGGLNLRVGYNANFDAFNTSLEVPLFKLIAPTKGQLEIQNLAYNSNSHYSVNKIKVGDTNLMVPYASVQWKDKIGLNFKLGDVLYMLTGISSTEFLNGVDVINPANFTFKGISYSSTSEDVNNYFNANAKVNFASLTTNNQNYGPMNLDLSINHVLAPKFSELTDKLAALSANFDNSNDKDNQQLVATLKEYFGPILVNSPKIRLNNFSLNSPSWAMQLAGFVTTKDFTQADMQDSQKFMSKVWVDMKISVPKSVLSYLFVLQTKYLLGAGNAQMDQNSSEALSKVVDILLDSQINSWIKKGYLHKDDKGNLDSHMVLKDGQFYLNGMTSGGQTVAANKATK